MTRRAPPAKKIIPFTATANSLTWVGIMPARPSVGGRHFFRLSMEDTPQGRELVLRFAPWKPDTLAPDWTNAESRILIAGIHQLDVQAQGQPLAKRNPAEPWPQAWQIGWPVTDTLPEQLRLKLVDAQGDWPDWIIALHALPQGDSSFTRSIAGPI